MREKVRQYLNFRFEDEEPEDEFGDKINSYQ